jgi:hypothetical protein
MILLHGVSLRTKALLLILCAKINSGECRLINVGLFMTARRWAPPSQERCHPGGENFRVDTSEQHLQPMARGSHSFGQRNRDGNTLVWYICDFVTAILFFVCFITRNVVLWCLNDTLTDWKFYSAFTHPITKKTTSGRDQEEVSIKLRSRLANQHFLSELQVTFFRHF